MELDKERIVKIAEGMRRPEEPPVTHCPDDHELLSFLSLFAVAERKFQHLRECQKCLDKLRFAGHLMKPQCVIISAPGRLAVNNPASKEIKFECLLLACYDTSEFKLQASSLQLSGDLLANRGAYVTPIGQQLSQVVFYDCCLRRSVRKILERGASMVSGEVLLIGELGIYGGETRLPVIGKVPTTFLRA